MSKTIITAKFGEIDFEVYDCVHKTIEALERFEKIFKKLNIPLSFILAPKNIDKVENYKLRSFYTSICSLQMQNFASIEKDLESLSDILSIDYESPPTKDELQYEANK